MPAAAPPRSTREQGVSALCAAGCGVLAVLAPLSVAAAWALGSWDLLVLVQLVPADIRPDLFAPIQPWQRAVGGAVTLVPALLLSYGLTCARRSLLAFAQGDFFAAEVVEGLKGYAAATFWSGVASVLSVPLLSVAVTFANPPGHKELSLDLSGAQVLNLLAAAIVWVIASAMARAAALARENAQFV